MMMNIALCATNVVGLEVVKFLAAERESLACLILDSADPGGLNARIAEGASLQAGGRIFYSDSLQREETLAALGGLGIDLMLLAWWPYIIRPSLIRLPRLGCLNFHPSYLPHNRGKHYNFWTIVEESPFGVTLHWVNERVDAGDIAYQSRIEKTWEDTGATLYRKAQEEIVRLFKEKFPEIRAGAIPRRPQDAAAGSFHRASELEAASRIELEQSYRARDLLNILRARTFPPHPGAWFVDGGDRYEVRVEIRKVEGERRS